VQSHSAVRQVKLYNIYVSVDLSSPLYYWEHTTHICCDNTLSACW